MAIMPGVTWRPLKENATQARIKPTQIIYHTAVDQPGPTRLPDYFDRTDVTVESHFWIPLDGEIVQMMDTEVRADANRFANDSAISIETEDEGDPVGFPWTEAQLAALVRVAVWANKVHGIPLTICQSPTGPGQGFHSMWGAPSAWTPSRGKTCPGPTRIRQFHEELLPRLARATTPQEANAVNKSAADQLAEALYGALLLRAADPAGKEYWSGVGQKDGAVAMITGFLIGANPEIVKARQAQAAERAAISRDLAALKTAVGKLEAPTVDIDVVIDEIISRLES